MNVFCKARTWLLVCTLYVWERTGHVIAVGRMYLLFIILFKTRIRNCIKVRTNSKTGLYTSKLHNKSKGEMKSVLLRSSHYTGNTLSYKLSNHLKLITLINTAYRSTNESPSQQWQWTWKKNAGFQNLAETGTMETIART